MLKYCREWISNYREKGVRYFTYHEGKSFISKIGLREINTEAFVMIVVWWAGTYSNGETRRKELCHCRKDP